MHFHLPFCFGRNYSLLLHIYGLLKFYGGRQLNLKWINAQEVVTKSLVGSTHNRFRNENNNYYVCTTFAFHGFLVGNFWSRKNARTASSFPNLYRFFIIQVVRLYFCGVALWDSQLNTSFWAIKWSKNESKNAEFLPFQTSPQCSQEHAWAIIRWRNHLWQLKFLTN